STQPYSIDRWEQRTIPREIDREGVLNYAQPWQVPDRGMLLLYSRYTDGRQLYFSTTTDNGQSWSPRTMLSELPGHYQISWQHGQRVGTAFNRHPGSNVDARTDLFYMQTDNLGESWQAADGSEVAIPIKSVIANPLVRDYSN